MFYFELFDSFCMKNRIEMNEKEVFQMESTRLFTFAFVLIACLNFQTKIGSIN